jgi:hypothetical protein
MAELMHQHKKHIADDKLDEVPPLFERHVLELGDIAKRVRGLLEPSFGRRLRRRRLRSNRTYAEQEAQERSRCKQLSVCHNMPPSVR